IRTFRTSFRPFRTIGRSRILRVVGTLRSVRNVCVATLIVSGRSLDAAWVAGTAGAPCRALALFLVASRDEAPLLKAFQGTRPSRKAASLNKKAAAIVRAAAAAE